MWLTALIFHALCCFNFCRVISFSTKKIGVVAFKLKISCGSRVL